MKISVVVPNLNQSELLRRTLESIFFAGGAGIEVIVVDGGSVDGSLEVIRAYESRLAWWCSEPDGGQYAAINKGFARSTGEIMAWLNASDLYLPYTLGTVRDIFEQHSRVRWLTSLGKTMVHETGSLAYFGSAIGYTRRAMRAGLHGGPGNSGFIQQESCFWRRDLWEEIGGSIPMTYRFAADFHLWMKFFEKSPLVAVNAPLAAFRMHDSQRSLDHRYMDEVESILSQSQQDPLVEHESHWMRVEPVVHGEGAFHWEMRSFLSDEILFHPETSTDICDLNQSKLALLAAHNEQKKYIEELEQACADRLQALTTLNAEVSRLQTELLSDRRHPIKSMLQSLKSNHLKK